MAAEQSAGVNAILRALRKSYKELPLLLGKYYAVNKKATPHIESICNQVEQRGAVTRVNLMGTHVGKLPEFKSRLLATIDKELTRLCQLVLEVIEEEEEVLCLLTRLYSRSGEVCNRYDLEGNALSSPSPTRPSIHTLMTGLDRVIVLLSSSLEKKREILTSMEPKSCTKSNFEKELKNNWKISYRDQKEIERITADGNIFLEFFIEK